MSANERTLFKLLKLITFLSFIEEQKKKKKEKKEGKKNHVQQSRLAGIEKSKLRVINQRTIGQSGLKLWKNYVPV